MIKNQIKTVILLGLLTALLLWVGNLLGGRTGLYFGLLFAIIMNFSAYWFSDKFVLAMYKAKQVTESQQPKLYRMVREIIQNANLPIPKIYLIPSNSPNAFATGRNPKHAVVAVTQGILDLLSENELKGVLAHEISHIKNRDILIQSIAATIAGVISYLAMIARWTAIFSGYGGRDRDSGSGIELLVLAILTPLIATIIQLAISRSREYLADEGSAKLLHSGNYLADALEKLNTSIKHNPLRFGSKATSCLFIANPFAGRSLLNLFSTHPSMTERIKRLKNMNF